MARIGRVVDPGTPHHVTAHSVGEAALFSSVQDRLYYLDVIRRYSKVYGVEIVCWTLMRTHVHHDMVPPSKDALSSMMRESHREYGKYSNKRHGRRGHVFEERFFSCPMDESHFIASLAYIARNPVRAGIVDDPVEYRWSSAAYLAGAADSDPLVATRTPFDMAIDFQVLFKNDDQRLQDEIRAATRKGLPAGDPRFVAEVERRLGFEPDELAYQCQKHACMDNGPRTD